MVVARSDAVRRDACSVPASNGCASPTGCGFMRGPTQKLGLSRSAGRKRLLNLGL